MLFFSGLLRAALLVRGWLPPDKNMSLKSGTTNKCHPQGLFFFSGPARTLNQPPRPTLGNTSAATASRNTSASETREVTISGADKLFVEADPILVR